MDSYATADQLASWLSKAAPANAAQLLRSATIRVARACNRSPYDTPTGNDAQPLQDATCAQAAAWIGAGIDPDTLGLDTAPVKQSKILTGDVTYDTTGQAAARQQAAAALCPEAEAILLAAGLLWAPVPVGADPDDALPQWGLGRRWFPYPEPMSGEVEWPSEYPWP